MGTSTAGTPAAKVLTTEAFSVSRNISIIGGSTNTADYIVGGSQTSGVSTYSGTININNHIGGLHVISAAGGIVDFNGEIQGTQFSSTSDPRLTKIGEGVVRFTRVTGNTYAGGTTVSAGTLLVNNLTGSGTGAGAVAVNGGTLGGTGAIGGEVTVASGATLLGGDGSTVTGNLSLSGGLTLNDGAILQLALGDGAHSTLARTGGTSWTFDDNQTFSFIDLGAQAGIYAGIITGLDIDPGTTGSWNIANAGWSGAFTYNGGDIDLTLSAIPEPSTLGILGVGAAGLLIRRRVRI